MSRPCRALVCSSECEAVKAKVQWFNGLEVQMRARAQTRQRTRGDNELQEIDGDKTKDQLQLLPDTYS